VSEPSDTRSSESGGGPEFPPGARRRALVTGASRGIGWAITRRLLDDGWHVIGIARDFSRTIDRGESVASDAFRPIELDLSDLDRLPGRLADLRGELSELDAVVLNAGRGEFGSLEELSFDAIRELIEFDLVSPMFVARAVLPFLKRRGRGDLVFIGSESALEGRRKGTVYCAAKFGLRGFARALRDECAASGVRVTIVQPGMVATTFFDALDFGPGERPENRIEASDVADAVALIVDARAGTVFDEIVLSPLTRVVRSKPRSGPGDRRDAAGR
jgi:3-hydroxy acid dehydrogenase/malonic semialdehyde reductase